MVELSQEQKQEIVNQAIESLKTKTIEEAAGWLSRMVRDAVVKETDTQIKEWVTTDIIPPVLEHLQENKEALIEAAILSANDIAEKLRELLVAKVVEQLKPSAYGNNELIKKLFGLH